MKYILPFITLLTLVGCKKVAYTDQELKTRANNEMRSREVAVRDKIPTIAENVKFITPDAFCYEVTIEGTRYKFLGEMWGSGEIRRVSCLGVTLSPKPETPPISKFSDVRRK